MVLWLFHVLNWRRLQTPSCSASIWCFNLLLFSISSVDVLVRCFMRVRIHLQTPLMKRYLLQFAYVVTPTFQPHPSVKTHRAIFQVDLLRHKWKMRMKNKQIENQHPLMAFLDPWIEQSSHDAGFRLHDILGCKAGHNVRVTHDRTKT